MKKILLLLMICLIILASACHKSVPAYYPVNATVKADFDYKVGTYWIYQDALSGEVDSFIVWENLDMTDQNQSLNYSFEDIAIAIHQYGAYGDSEWVMELIEANISLSTPYTGYDPFSLYPFQVGEIPNGSDNAYVISIFPTYSLNGQTFETVEEISHVGGTFNSFEWNDTFYFSPTAGIIKMILNHPQDTTYNQHRVWELLRYNIVK